MGSCVGVCGVCVGPVSFVGIWVDGCEDVGECECVWGVFEEPFIIGDKLLLFIFIYLI